MKAHKSCFNKLKSIESYYTIVELCQIAMNDCPNFEFDIDILKKSIIVYQGPHMEHFGLIKCLS